MARASADARASLASGAARPFGMGSVCGGGTSLVLECPLLAISGWLVSCSARCASASQTSVNAVDQHDDEIAGCGQIDASVCGRDLVGHGVDAIRGQAGIEHGLPQQGGHLAAGPAARVVVLADDDLVEGLSRQQCEGADVLVAAVAGDGDDADGARRPRRA